MIYSQIKTNKFTFIKEKSLSVFNLFRGSDWWLYQIPKLLSVAYAQILLQAVPPQKSITTVIALLASMFFVAAYGHVINDTFDIDADLRANKPNRIAYLSKLKRNLLTIGLATAGLIPWLWIGFIPSSAILLATLYISLTIYAAPPLRLKERDAWGVISDAFSVHLVPTLLVATVFLHLNDTARPESIFLAVVSTACYFLMGIRGIISHQISDRENDLKSGVKTLIANLDLVGINQIIFWVTRIFLPAEIILLVAMILIISQSAHLLIVFFVCYGILSIINFKRWFFNTIDLTYVEGYYIFPHDLYEVWLPLSLLCFLSLQQPSFLILLILHILLFYPGIISRWSSLSPIFISVIKHLKSHRNFWSKNNLVW
ncbi:UbiA family prenyltransferase [Nostoc sp.]